MLLVVSAVLYFAVPGNSLIVANESSIEVHQVEKSANSQSVWRSRARRETSSLSKDEVGWANINEEVDEALKKIWPHMVEKGYTSLTLPDLEETISVRLLLITNAAGLRLSNGNIYNMEGLERAGDVYMTYNDKSFQFRLNMNIKNMQFVYDFLLSVMGFSGGGTVGGILQDTFVTGDFSISGDDASLKLDNFRVVSFGNMGVSLLKSNPLIRQISGSILTPITRLFDDHIAYSISETLRDQIRNLMDDINRMDQLELKQLLNSMLAGLIGQT